MYLSIVMSRKKSKLGHRVNNTDGSDTQCEPRNKKRGRRPNRGWLGEIRGRVRLEVGRVGQGVEEAGVEHCAMTRSFVPAFCERYRSSEWHLRVQRK